MFKLIKQLTSLVAMLAVLFAFTTETDQFWFLIILKNLHFKVWIIAQSYVEVYFI